MQYSLSELAVHADNILGSAPGDADVLKSCEPLFRKVLTEGLHIAALHSLLRQNLAGKREVTPDISSGQFLVLASSAISTWAILRHSGSSRRLYMSPNHAMSTKIAGSPLAVVRYGLPSISDAAILDTAATLTLESNTQAALGQVIFKNGNTTVLDFGTAPASPAFTLRLNTMPHGDYEWAFDRATLKPTQVSGVRQLESNITTIFDLLQATRSPLSVEQLVPFVEHRMHFVRWKAIQTIGAIDRVAGIAQVEKVADDPHPEVRAAARRTLAACG